MSTYAVVSFPSPELHGPACTGCAGVGVTGEHFAMDTDRHPLLVDVFCPCCGGCGQLGHATCTAVSPCAQTGDIDEAAEADELEERCPSCQGRGWNAVQGLDGSDQPENEVELKVLRVPCGCAIDRVELVEAVDPSSAGGSWS